MHRFFVPEGSPGEGLILTDREAHHGLDVLRLRPEDVVATLNGRGLVRECVVSTCSRGRVELAVKSEFRAPRPACAITLAQALPKGKAFELIIQKATEIGASRIIPLLTTRVIVELDGKDAQRKVLKWRQIAIEAAKQCGTPWLPEIEEPVSLPELLKRGALAELQLAACLLPEARHARHFLDRFKEEHQTKPRSAALFIGPEGDFTPAEYKALLAYGALPVTLGPNVLRADTAAVYGLSILSYEMLAGASLPQVISTQKQS